MSSSTGTVVFNDSRIKATGVIATESIGVGTANPTSNLHVVGDASIQSNLEVGTANLFVDTTTGNVGVGKTNPGTALEVYSSTGTQLTLSSSSRYTTIYGVDDTGSCFFGNDGGSFRITTGGDTSGTGASEALRVNSSGNVGIGTTSPTSKLHVDGNIVTDQGHYINITRDDTTGGPAFGILNTDGSYSGWFGYGSSSKNELRMVSNSNYPLTFWTSDTGSGVERMRIAPNGNVGIGEASPTCPLHIKQKGDSYANTNDSNGGLQFERYANSNRWDIYIYSNNNLHFDYNGGGKAYVDEDLSGYTQMNFTGQHRTFIKDVPFTEAMNLEGLIVSANNNKYIKMTGGIEVGSNAITTNESLPVVSLSTKANDKKCFGVISVSEDPETREEKYGNFVSVFQKELGDTRVYINSVGEGAVWVVNTNGPLESGDYITTSNVPGYGQKQDSEFLANYTVAKITMDCDFDPVTQPLQVIKKDEDGVNVLDEHGQLQWEDHPSETEKAYKIRYLTADGQITDEANAVHIAAFVGCTYHCG